MNITIDTPYAVCYEKDKRIKIESYDDLTVAFDRFVYLSLRKQYVTLWNTETGDIQSTVAPFKDIAIRKLDHQVLLFNLEEN